MKKIGIIIIALVIMMGSLGVGYAMWGQNLYVNGTADTGSLTAIFDSSDVTGSPCGDYLEAATVDISGSGTDTLTVKIHNAYPGMQALFPVKIKNTGTIPITNVGFVSASLPNMPAGSIFGSVSIVMDSTPLEVGDTATANLTIYISDSATEAELNEGYTGEFFGFTGTIRASQ